MCAAVNGNGGNGNGNGTNGDGTRPRLTGLQRAFVDAYMGDARFNATEAAAQAGYQGNRATLASMASYNMRNAAVLQEIAYRWTLHGANDQEVTTRLVEWMRFDPSVLFDEYGNLDPRKVKEHARYLKRIWYDAKGRLCVEVHDPMRAAETLARTLGMFQQPTQEVEHTGEVVWSWAKPDDQPDD